MAAPHAAHPDLPAAPRMPTMPLAEVRAGMEATVLTVFEGGRVEEFQAEIVGVMDGFLGPKQDLILARLKGERVQYTGVAAGMSGSPVYIGGRLVGALSYRIGTFLKEPIAGITPIEYMLAIKEGQAYASTAGPGGAQADAVLEPGISLEPIETPVIAAGVPAEAIHVFGPQLEKFGLGRLVPGAAAAAGASAPVAAPLMAGQPVAAQLVSGDISVAATGTVTLVEGNKVFAFGHPALLTGETQFPMARAEIYLTLPSLQASTKLSRVLDTIGTFRQSRLPGITGEIGSKPSLVHVEVRVAPSGSAPAAFHYEIFEHRDLTPALVGLVTMSSLLNTPWSADEMTMSLSARIGLVGHPDVALNDLYTGAGSQPAATALARDVQELFGAVYQNQFEKAVVRSVNLEVSAVENNRLSVVDSIYPSRTRVEPGDEVTFKVLIRPYRGTPYTRGFTYRVPQGMPSGTLAVYIGGANLLGVAERPVLARQVSQADDLDQIIGLINRLRTSNRLYLKITRRQAGAIVQSEVLPSLPPSVFSTLGFKQGAGEVTPLVETTVHEESILLDDILVGGAAVPLRIR
jgi:hypothetical protein